MSGDLGELIPSSLLFGRPEEETCNRQLDPVGKYFICQRPLRVFGRKYCQGTNPQERIYTTRYEGCCAQFLLELEGVCGGVRGKSEAADEGFRPDP